MMFKLMSGVLVILFISICNQVLGEAYCPSLCQCKSTKTADILSSEEEGTDWIKLKCGSSDNPITELKEIDLSRVSQLVVNLNLSGNDISTLSRDLNLPALEKLDLSYNHISLIESDAFYNLSGLQRLDLSNNAIKSIYKEIFKGLVNLERVILSQNQISILSSDTFYYLLGLKQIDISGNPLICDCDLLWIGNWSRSVNVKLIGNPKCAQPESLRGQSIKKLKIEKCSLISNPIEAALVLRPQNGQVVFEGDSLVLTCKAPFSAIKTIYNLTWTLPGILLDENFRINNVDILEKGQAETVLSISKIMSNHTGKYKCTYSKDNSTDLAEYIDVVVISNLTRYCPITVTSNNKGVYTWPGSIRGHAVTQSCYNKDGALAFYNCGNDGNWSYLNTSACPYASETTKMLEQFAFVNLTVIKGSVMAACQKLHTLLLQNSPPATALQDPDEINFIALAIDNYMKFIETEKDLGSVLLDVVNIMMTLPLSVLRASENLYHSCSNVVGAIETISQYASNIQGHKTNLAVERFSIKRESFTGMTCVWFSTPGIAADAGTGDGRMLHCSTTNRTITPLLTDRDKLIQASIQLPATLLYRMDHQALTMGAAGVHQTYSLIVSMYDSAALFPRLPSPKASNRSSASNRMWDFYGARIQSPGGVLAITTPVVGVKLVNVSLTDPLAEPVYIIVRDSGLTSGVGGRAVLWDEKNKIWSDSPDGCSVHTKISNMVVIQCYKLGYVGLLQNIETGIYGGRSGGARFKFSHPAIYVGSIILLVCLLVAILSYTLCYSAIHMSARAKHSSINTWLALSLLCFMYTLGIYQTEDVQLCQAIGLLLHYLTLSSLLWMTVSVSQLYKFLSKNHNRPLHTPEDELPPEVPVQKPILGIYLVGWGIALIICGISGAVNMREYASYSHCFLSTAPALSAVFVPAGIIIVFISILFLLIRCTVRNVNGQLSEGTQATENVDLEMWEPGLLVNNNTADAQSVRSATESEMEDTEHTPIVQLRAHVIVLCVYLSVWSCGTMAIYHPFSILPYQEDIFSILYALCATVLGTFILFFYGIARSDVRSQWLLMHCYLKKRKQCCRTRSVFDANAQNHQALAPISNVAAAQARSRSNSQNSNRTNSKSNNSNILKAAAELNGHTLNDSLPNGNKISNMNLMVLHRQQYRSNNSVTTYPEIGPDGAEIFYNANQSNVARKFFKKQRKHVRHNCLDIPRRRNYDSDSQISTPHLPPVENMDGIPSIFTSGSKVNNTNIHIERGQVTDNGMKESRHQMNPNILSELDENNCEKPQLKRFVLEKEGIPNKRDKMQDMKSFNQSPIVMNIYTNVPETRVPQHQIVSSVNMKPDDKDHEMHSGQSSNMLADCMNSEMPTMRTVSQQCSLEYSSTSEVATPLNQLGSDKTLNTHSELTSLQETHSALCSAHDMSDTEEALSFAKYTDYKNASKKGIENSKQHTSCSKLENKKFKSDASSNKALNRSLQEINSRSNEELNNYETSTPIPPRESHSINEKSDACESDNLVLDDTVKNNIQKNSSKSNAKNRYYEDNGDDKRNPAPNNSTVNAAGEINFENESDIYFPNYQMSEVSIRSHGLYAPPPPAICANDLDLTFSNGELSRTQQDDDCYENQYVNYNPAWRRVKEGLHGSNSRFYHSPAASCPDVNRVDNDSPVSLVSEIDELYKQITSRDRLSHRHQTHHSAYNARSRGDNGLRHCESDSCISESHSDILDSEHKAETRV